MTSPLVIPLANLIHVIARSAMLQVKQLRMNFIFAERIVTARSVKVDDVTDARILQNRLHCTQRLLKNRRKFYVAVAAVGESILGDNARRSGR